MGGPRGPGEAAEGGRHHDAHAGKGPAGAPGQRGRDCVPTPPLPTVLCPPLMPPQDCSSPTRQRRAHDGHHRGSELGHSFPKEI